MSRPTDAQILFRSGGAELARTGCLWLRRRSTLTEPEAATISRADAATCAGLFGKDNVLRTAAANKLRADWIDGNAALLIEPGSTNGMLWAGDPNNAAWTKTRTTITNNTVTGLDGTTSGDKLKEDSSASTTHFLAQNTPTLTDNTLQTWYVIARKAERTWIALELLGKDGTTRSCYFNISAGTIGTAISGGVGIIRSITLPDGNTGYICALVATSSSGATTPVARCYLATADNTASYTGDGASGVYLYHAQFEANKAFPSSPIVTSGSALTRAADSLTFPIGFPPEDALTLYLRVGRPMWADATGIDLTAFPSLMQLGSYPGALRLYADQTTRVFKADVNAGAVASQNIPAGTTIDLCVNALNLTSGGQVRLDVGSGFSSYTAAATALAAWNTANTLTLGNGPIRIQRCLVARGLFALADMQTVPW